MWFFRVNYIITAAIFLVLLVAECSSDGDPHSDGDIQENETEVAEEKTCEMLCDTRDQCVGFAMNLCTGDPTLRFEICFDGILYHCETPADSICCEGLGMEFLPVGVCETNTPGCGENTDGDGVEVVEESESAEDAGESE